MKDRTALADRRLWREQCYVGGQWIDATDGARIEVNDPATGIVLATVPALSADETRDAIVHADRAFATWRDADAYDRYRLLHRMAHLMRDHQADLALIMSLEQGKPLAESAAEIEQSARYYEWFAEEARRHGGELIPSGGPGQLLQARREPIGVAVAITPWNFPASMIARKAGAAIAAGCTLIVKPAEATPLSALAQAELFDRAGAPPGVFNVITGVPQVLGEALTADARVRKLSFTGSTGVGRLLMQQSAPTLKRLSLELGGNAPFIVFADADLDAAVEGAVASRFRNAGQTCVSANRILVERSIAGAFLERLTASAASLRVGRFDQPGAQCGPLINAAAVAKVHGLIREAVAAGARVLTGGEAAGASGRFWQPTVLADVTPGMRVAREESFGPVAPVLVFNDEAHALALANDTDYGLAAYVYTRDLARCHRLQRRIEAGMVGFNQPFIATETAPFGGIKASGFGREGSHLGISEYQQVKLVAITTEAQIPATTSEPSRSAVADVKTPTRASRVPRENPTNTAPGTAAPSPPWQPLPGPQPVRVDELVEAHADGPRMLPAEPVRLDTTGTLPAGMPRPADSPTPVRRTVRWPA